MIRRGRAWNPFGVEALGPEGTTWGEEGAAGAARARAAALLEEPGARVALVGRHGAGKSTLAADLVRAWRAAGAAVAVCRARDEVRWPPLRWWGEAARARLVVVDGAEALARPAAWGVLALAAARGAGARWLLTLHEPSRWATTVEVEPDAAAIAALVARRLAAAPAGAATGRGAPDAATVARWLAATRGDARALLFLLYDAWEEGGAARWRVAAERLLAARR